MDHITGTAVSTETALYGEDRISPSNGFASVAFPEVDAQLSSNDLQSGVSTNNVFRRSNGYYPDSDEIVPRWYALRATYSKERAAYEYINSHGGQAYCPCIRNVRLVRGKRRKVVESYVPNILFAYGSIKSLRTFVYDNVNLPYLRFYEGMREVGGVWQRRPLFIPAHQMESLRRICEAEAGGAFIPADKENLFKVGDWVKVKEGSKFAGIKGRVARYKGQQCVGVQLGDLMMVATAYIPSFLLEKLEPEEISK